MINMVSESQKPVQSGSVSANGLDSLFITREQRYKSDSKSDPKQFELVSLAMMKQHVNKQYFKLQNDVAKLLTMYSHSQSTEGLTREQFKTLARDLYATVDKDRVLTQEELDNLVNLLDTDKNQLISREQIVEIVEEK